MNYKIVGADQKEYGPVSLDQLRQWVAEGRANDRTLVQLEGTQDWKPLAEFAELAALLPRAAAPQPGLAGTVPPLGPIAPLGQPAGLPGGDAPANAAVKVPAILLLVAGGLGVVGGIFGLLQQMFGWAMPAFMPPNLPPEMERWVRLAFQIQLPLTLTALAMDAVILYGGLSMLNLRRWGLALAACILALVCGNPCCCPIGLVGGIWGLIQLLNPQVKASFF